MASANAADINQFNAAVTTIDGEIDGLERLDDSDAFDESSAALLGTLGPADQDEARAFGIFRVYVQQMNGATVVAGINSDGIAAFLAAQESSADYRQLIVASRTP